MTQQITLKIKTPRVFLPLLKPTRYKCAFGGRGSGKSFFFAEALIEHCVLNPGTRWVCLREVQKTLDQSVKKLLENKIIDLGVGRYFEVQLSKIITPGGGVIIFQGMQDHTAESIKSLEGMDGAWFEEAQTMTASSLELLRPTIRKENSQLWFSWNPRSISDPVDMFFRGSTPPPDSIVVNANYTDNPFLPQVLKDEIEFDKVNSPELFAHIWLGAYRPDNANSVIPSAWITAAIDAHKKLGIEPSGIKSAALDVADEGADLNAIAIRHGILIQHVESWRGSGSDIFKSVEKAFHICDDFGAVELRYDSDGVGAGVRGDARILNESRENQIKAVQFHGGGKVVNADRPIPSANQARGDRTNADFFLNAKAQAWWSLRVKFQITYRAVVDGAPYDKDEIISISSEFPEYIKLVNELSQPTYDTNGAGKLFVEKAPDGQASPNLADSVMMVFAPKERRRGIL